jgi:DNA-binding response OmpR family regulator
MVGVIADIREWRSRSKAGGDMSNELGPALLCVEDDFFTQDEIEVALAGAGYEVISAVNGAEAIRCLRSGERPILGLVTDVDLGAGPDGWDVAREARELVAAMPVVYVSGGGAENWAAQGVPHSVMIAKPFAAAQVVTAISSLLNSTDGVLVSAAVA